LAEREIVTVSLHVELLGEGIDSLNHISDTVGDDIACGRDLVSSQVVVTNEALAWLVDIEAVGELLTTEEESESISAVIGAVALTDFKCIISQIIVNHVIQVICCGEEAQHAAIIVEELLLGLNLATTELLLHEVSHLGVSLGRHGPLRHLEVVIGRFRRRRQLSSLALIEGTSVLITVVNADLSSVNSSVTSDREVIWHIGVTIVLENNLAFQESALWNARVDLLGLSDHN